jgi:anti-sigma regulatory factor (Ser/Thr protein kinase)
VRAGVKQAGVLDGDVRFCLVLPREALSVPVMRRVLGGTLLGFGADEDCVADILLAASEACTNVLKHGGRSGEYEVSASVGKNACLLEIADGTSARGPRPARHPDVRRMRAASKTITRVRHIANGIPTVHGPVVSNGSGNTADGGTVLAEAEAEAEAEVQGEAEAEAEVQDEVTSEVPATSPAEPDVGSLQESGRGLTIMRACMDDLTMRGTRGRGTVVSMRKQITWAPTVTGRHAGGTRPASLRDAG